MESQLKSIESKLKSIQNQMKSNWNPLNIKSLWIEINSNQFEIMIYHFIQNP